MSDEKSTKRRFLQVILSLATILAIVSIANGRGGGGGGRSGGGEQYSGGFSRTENFSRGSTTRDVPAATFEKRSSVRFSDNGSSARMNAAVDRGTISASAPRQFAQTHQVNNMANVAQSPQVSRESVMRPMSATARTVSPAANARTVNPVAHSGRLNGISVSTGHHQLAVATTTNRMSIMRPLGATTTHGFISSSRTVASSNHAIASNLGGRHNSGSGWHQSNAWQGNGNHGNSWHGNWRQGNAWHGNHHHHDFDNDDVFFAIGGFWPWWGWWGGWYPYYWYPYYGYPYYGSYYGYGASIDYPVGGNTYNYYNYDNASGALQPGSTINGMQVPDYDALRAVGQNTKTQPATQSDQLFDDGVKAFGSQDYATSIEKFRTAVRLEPDDTVLPFAYAQALFANAQYEQAAAVITTTLAEMTPHKADISYPRGLYKDENILTAQIENLHRAVLMDPQNAQLQLLYGYQLLGVGKTDEAAVPLAVAKRDARTQAPAASLLDVLERAKQPTMTPAK